MKRIFVIFCCICMIFGSFTSVFAGDDNTEILPAPSTDSENTVLELSETEPENAVLELSKTDSEDAANENETDAAEPAAEPDINNDTDPAPDDSTDPCSDGDITTHTPGEPVKENETAEGYEEAVYCSVCGELLSRRTVRNINAFATVKLPADSYTYNGKVRKPAATVTAAIDGEEVILTKGTDYKVSYNNNTDAGIAIVTVEGIGDYTGTISASFEIKPASIAKSTLEIKNGKTSFTYTGEKIKPTIVVTSSLTGKTLKKGTDYTVSYKNNKNAGEATIIVTGTGNYKSTLKMTFTIKPKKLDKSFFFITPENKYTGKPVKPILNGYYNELKLKKDVDYTVTYHNNVNTYPLVEVFDTNYTSVGTYSLLKSFKSKPQPYALVKGKGNYSGSVKVPFGIDSRFVTMAKGYSFGDDRKTMYVKAGDSFQLKLDYSYTDNTPPYWHEVYVSPKGGTWKIEEISEECKGYYETVPNKSSITLSKTGWVKAVKKGSTLVSYTKDNKEVSYTLIVVQG